MSLTSKARPERFELPTLWFEVRDEAFLKCEEFRELVVSRVFRTFVEPWA
jgi:hypothetical protein